MYANVQRKMWKGTYHTNDSDTSEKETRSGRSFDWTTRAIL